MFCILPMLKIFRPPAGAEKKKNEAAFHNFFEMPTCTNFFLCYESCWKHRRGIFLIVRIIYFNFDHFWNFLICGSGVISCFPETTYFSGVYPAKFKIIFSVLFIPSRRFMKKIGKKIFSSFFSNFLWKSAPLQNSG